MAFDANDPETKAALKEAVEAAIEEATTGLIAKNRELIGKNKALAKGQEIDPKVVEDLEAEIDKLKTDKATSDKALKDAGKLHEATTTQLQAESGFTQKLLVENGLMEALAKNGVTNPVHQKAAVAMLRGSVNVTIDGENRKAMFGDKELAIAVKEWATGDEGKHFVTAAVNSGGSANGGGSGASGAKVLTRSAFDALTVTQQAAHSKSGGTLTD